MNSTWSELLSSGEERILPWIGGRRIEGYGRCWKIVGELPQEYGWYRFRVTGSRGANLLDPAERDVTYEEGRQTFRGYLVGQRLIRDEVRVDPDPNMLVRQTRAVYLVDQGLERFCRAVAVKIAQERLVYMRQEFPQGPEDQVRQAFEDRLPSVDHVANVTPALDLAFRYLSYQRKQEEERRHLKQLQEDERRQREQWTQRLNADGGGLGRRDLARHDFPAAAQAALRLSQAELVDTRPALGRNEMVVIFRFRHRRFECVVHRYTLQVIDAGICLTDESTQERGDEYFTLESLPAVIAQAIDYDLLVVHRHA